MADLGTINATDGGQAVLCHIPSMLYHSVLMAEWPSQDGRIGGNVTESGVPVEGCEVLILWRKSAKVIHRAFTDKNGDWEIVGFDPSLSAQYSVLIKDKAGGTVYNDAVYSLIAPV